MGELRDLSGRRALIQVDGDTIAGHVDQVGKQTIALTGAVALVGGTETPIDGEVIVMIDHITWMQVP